MYRINKIKLPKKISQSQLKNYFIKLGLKNLVNLSRRKDQKINELVTSNVYKPELYDLYRISELIKLIYAQQEPVINFRMFPLAKLYWTHKYSSTIK